jgi:hypothetical protein
VTSEEQLRDLAIRQLKKKQDFWRHVGVYVVINSFLIGIWYFTAGRGYFWPAWVLLGWGVGVVFNAWDAYGSQGISEAQIQREMERQRGRDIVEHRDAE